MSIELRGKREEKGVIKKVSKEFNTEKMILKE